MIFYVIAFFMLSYGYFECVREPERRRKWYKRAGITVVIGVLSEIVLGLYFRHTGVHFP